MSTRIDFLEKRINEELSTTVCSCLSLKKSKKACLIWFPVNTSIYESSYTLFYSLIIRQTFFVKNPHETYLLLE